VCFKTCKGGGEREREREREKHPGRHGCDLEVGEGSARGRESTGRHQGSIEDPTEHANQPAGGKNQDGQGLGKDLRQAGLCTESFLWWPGIGPGCSLKEVVMGEEGTGAEGTRRQHL
jgi:hypothetical protein